MYKDYYNSIIENASAHVELLQSTQYGHYAQSSSTDTAFTDAMFGTIQKNSALWNAQDLNDDYGKMCVVFPDILEEVREEMAGLGVSIQPLFWWFEIY